MLNVSHIYYLNVITSQLFYALLFTLFRVNVIDNNFSKLRLNEKFLCVGRD